MPASIGQYNFGIYNGGFYNQGYDPNAFSFTPNFTYPLEVSMLTQVEEHEDGTERRISKMPWGIRTFEAEFLGQTNDQKDLLTEFFESKKGNHGDFSYVDPVDSTEYNVRFDEARLIFVKRPDTLWDVTIKLREVQ
jgi:hypothetical protein